MSSMTATLLDAALDYARMEWHVFPCHATGHQPLVARGFYAATSDLDVIKSWWSRYPGAAIGLRTGQESGVFAVDIDPRHGGDVSLEHLEAEHGELPETVESQTGGGGRHVFLRWSGRTVACSTGKIGTGIDIKGTGGYVILPPSDHESGRQYCWLIGRGPWEQEIAEAPEWLLAMIDPARTPEPPASGAAIGDEIPEGYRNRTLAGQAGHMRQIGMTAEEIAPALQAINFHRCRPPLEEGEVEQIARSIGRYDPDTCRQAQMECWPERFLAPENVNDGASLHGAPIFRCMDDIEIEDIDWLWRGFLAGGKLAMFSGNPGTGKSTISVDLAARISTGADWPDGSPGCEPGSVVLLSKEDAPEDTIKPRLKLAGAEMSKIYILEGVKQADLIRKETVEADFNLDRDLFALEQLLQRLSDCRLVVIDPIGNYMGEANSHNDAAVRRVLGPLAKLAMKYDVAVLAVAHLNKDSEKAAIYRTLGSVGFVGIARMAFGAILDPDDPSKKRRYLLPIKSNLGSDRTGLAYSIETELIGRTDHAKIAWDPEPVTVSIDDLVGRKHKSKDDNVDLSGITGPSPKGEKLMEAVEWLVWRLAPGQLSKQEVLACARKDGIAASTLDRAKTELGIKPCKQGFGKDGGWFWRLPDDVDPADYLGDDWDRQPDECAECAPTGSAKILKQEAILGGIPPAGNSA